MMESAAEMAANAEKKSAFGDTIAAGIQSVAGLAKAYPGAAALAALL
jgi:hypothetical protein